MQLGQCTASLPGGSGQWNSCNALPHCLGAVGSATPALHCLTAWGQWAAQLIGPLHRACRAAPSLLSVWCCTAWCCALHCTVCALLHCSCGQRAAGSGTPATHCHTAWRLWAVELLLHTAALPGGSGQWNSCDTLPLCLGAAGCATPAMHCLTAWGQWAVQLLLNTASPPGGSGHWSSRSCCNALLLCLGALCDSAQASAEQCRPSASVHWSGYATTHYHTTRTQHTQPRSFTCTRG